MAMMSQDDKEKQGDVQALLCGVLQVSALSFTNSLQGQVSTF